MYPRFPFVIPGREPGTYTNVDPQPQPLNMEALEAAMAVAKRVPSNYTLIGPDGIVVVGSATALARHLLSKVDIKELMP